MNHPSHQLYELARSLDRTDMRVTTVERETATHGSKIAALEALITRIKSYGFAALVLGLSLLNLGRDATIEILVSVLKAAGR